jgi:hypothetical protein
MPTLAYRTTLPDRIAIASDDDDEIARVAGAVFDRLADGALAALIKTSRLALAAADRERLARRIVDAFADRVRRGFELDVATEVDRPQRCDLPAGATRTLLPHHDGGHCSYLTAPALAGPPPRRSLANAAFTTTDDHKLYQGLLLRDAGDAMSLTSYFDLVRLLIDGWIYQRRERPTLDALLAGYQARVTEAIERAGDTGYLPIGAQLGATGAARDIAIHAYEASHGTSTGARCRLAAHALAEDLAHTALGMSFGELMARHAVLAPAETGDLLIGHNLFAWHGGVEGGAGREILPICVTAPPTGPAYERWLAVHWERFFAGAS